MTADFRYITNNDGRFYAGMTAQEAKRNDSYKCTLRRDFRNLDKNKDGVLSVEEIMKERKSEQNIALFSTLAWLALGIGDAIFEKGKIDRIGWLAVDAIITGISAANFLKISRKTKEYQQALAQPENKRLDKQT